MIDLSQIKGLLAQLKSVSQAINNKPDSTSVYSKTETDTKLVEKADNTAVYTKQETDTKLVEKADSTSVYSKAETDTHLATKETITKKGIAGGYTPLDEQAKIPSQYIPDSLIGALMYRGIWDMHTPLPQASTHNKGHYYIAINQTPSMDGYVMGDWAISNGTSWDKIDNTDAVQSIAGRSGHVVLNKVDVGLGNVDNTADADKPVSTKQQTELDKKAVKTELHKVSMTGDFRDLLNTSIKIARNTDFNSLIKVGFYYIDSDADFQTCINRPGNESGYLEVLGDSNYWILQRYTVYNNKVTYTRRLYNGVWDSWIINNPYMSCKLTGLLNKDGSLTHYKTINNSIVTSTRIGVGSYRINTNFLSTYGNCTLFLNFWVRLNGFCLDGYVSGNECTFSSVDKNNVATDTYIYFAVF